MSWEIYRVSKSAGDLGIGISWLNDFGISRGNQTPYGTKWQKASMGVSKMVEMSLQEGMLLIVVLGKSFPRYTLFSFLVHESN